MQFKTYVISLQNETERRKNITQQLEEKNIPFQFMNAVDLRNTGNKELASIYSSELAKKHLQRELGKGEIGCALSHINIYQDLLSSKKEWALVIEDDALLQRLDSQKINSLCLPDAPYDTMILGYSKLLPKNEKRYYWRFPIKSIIKYKQAKAGLPFTQWACGTVAYLISKKGAQKIINAFQQQSQLISTVADDWSFFEKECDLTIFHYRPIMVFEDFSNLTSSIEADRNLLGSAEKNFPFIEFFRDVKGLIRQLIVLFK